MKKMIATLAICLAGATPAIAQSKAETPATQAPTNSAKDAPAKKDAPAAQAMPAAAPQSLREELAGQYKEIEEKLTQLAEAIPQEKYTWRPGEGVRSVGEVFLHVAGGNFGMSSMAGVKVPEGIDRRNIEKNSTDKAHVLEVMKQSFANVRQALDSTTDADMEKMGRWGDGQKSRRFVLMYMAIHQSEHLGQAIAYARSIGVVPPWTEKRDAENKARQTATPAANQPKN